MLVWITATDYRPMKQLFLVSDKIALSQSSAGTRGGTERVFAADLGQACLYFGLSKVLSNVRCARYFVRAWTQPHVPLGAFLDTCFRSSVGSRMCFAGTTNPLIRRFFSCFSRCQRSIDLLPNTISAGFPCKENRGGRTSEMHDLRCKTVGRL